MLRRRSALGLLLLTALAGCAGSERVARDGQRALCSTDLAEGTGERLTFRALPGRNGPPGDAELRETAEKLCRRLAGFGRGRPAINVTGDLVNVVAPEGAPETLIDYAGSPGRVAVFDWERVILDEDCRTDPRLTASARSPVVGFERAVRTAAKCPGSRVVRQERPDPQAPRPDAWWIIRDEPVLGAGDFRDPVADTDPETDEPRVTMEFTETAQRTFTKLTRRIARRGAAGARPGVAATYSAHHFAIVLDADLVSVPFIDFEANPEGIDGTNGAQIAGGLTEDTARVLARLLEVGPLPVRLQPVDP